MIVSDLLPTLIVMRHPPVDARYQGVCYGKSDVELADDGRELSPAIVDQLATWKRANIVHSGLQRTRLLAEKIAERLGCRAECEPAIRERDFGSWELQSWNDIFARSGDDMMRIVSEPETFRPGGGETTFELRDRVWKWFRSLPTDSLTIAVTHGGPIASLIGTQRQLPVADWPKLIPRCGQFLSIPRDTAKRVAS